jgi:small conductance mechanosensitive channel
MEELQMRTGDLVEASEAAIRQAGALAVSYSFSILGAIILLIAGYIVAGLVERSIYAGLGRFRGFDETLRKFFSKTARYALLVLVGVTVLAQFGVQTASIIAALGAIGLAIGLALQGTLQNIAAGIMLLALRPFRVGEYIDAGNVAGTIQEIGLFATELKTLDGLYVLSPNSELWNTPVTNYSRNPVRRNDLTIGIGYGDDIDLALGLLRQIVEGDPRTLKEPEPMTYVDALADSSVNVTIRYWTTTPNWFQAKLDNTKAAKLAFDQNGISIPFPQQDVHYVPVPGRQAAPDAETDR